MNAIVEFADLLQILGHTTHTSICHQTPGGVFSTQIVTADQAAELAATITDANVWFGVNPVTGPPRTNAGRGTADQIEHLTALYADLDVKPDGLDTFDTAHQVVDVLSHILGTRPSVTVLSGNGLQPYWPIDDQPTGPDARALLRRFGRLVAAVAERHGGRTDSVYDLARVLRVPGSHNLKNPAHPKPVIALADTGRPLTVDEIDERLLEYGINENPEDRETLTAVIATTGEWVYADRTCVYVRQMIDNWKTDTPTARHPWLLSQTTRLAAAHRSGCLAQDDHTTALQALTDRFRHLLTNAPARAEQPGEIADAVSWGRARIAVKNNQQALVELGAHTHDDAILNLLPDPPPAPVTGWTPQVIQGGQHPTTATTDGNTALQLEAPAGTLERSEDGHAQQLITAYGDLIRYCPQRGSWLAWDGTVWQWQQPGGGIVREYAKKIARTFPQGDQAAVAHKRRALSASGTSGCLKQAESDPRVVVQVSDLDNHPWHLNTPAGMVDLRTGTISAPDPTMLATKMTTAAPDFNHPDPTFEAFLDDTFADNHELRDYVQRMMGVSLIGSVREQVLPFAQGAGANGKSTLMEAVMHAVGIGAAGYSMAAPAEMLMIRKHSEHPAELAQLAGARLVVCSELDDGQKFAEAKIKQLTGRDSINARFLYGQPFTFQPSHTIWLLGNHRPQARTGGQAFWRRVKLIDFANVVPTERRDPALGDKLAAAAGAVLAWAIRGAVDYSTRGIREPAEVSQAVESYAADQDTIGRFVEDQIHQSPNVTAARASVSDVRAAYERWCTEAGEIAASPKRLTQELRDRFGIDTAKSGSRRFYVGMTLYADPDAEPESSDEGWFR